MSIKLEQNKPEHYKCFNIYAGTYVGTFFEWATKSPQIQSPRFLKLFQTLFT